MTVDALFACSRCNGTGEVAGEHFRHYMCGECRGIGWELLEGHCSLCKEPVEFEARYKAACERANWTPPVPEPGVLFSRKFPPGFQVTDEFRASLLPSKHMCKEDH